MFEFWSANYSCEGVEFNFHKHAAVCFADSPKNISWKTENKKQTTSLAKNFVFFKWLLWARTKQFRHIGPKFLPEFGEKSVRAPKKLKQGTFFSSNCFCGEVESSFDKPAIFFLPKVQTFWAHNPKKKEKKVFSNFFPKWFLWTLTRQFRQSYPPPPQLAIFPKSSYRKSKKSNIEKIVQTFVLKFFLSRIECIFAKHADVFLPTAQKLSTKNPKKKDKLLAFLKPFVYLEWLVWPRTMQFRQTCLKFSARIWKKVRSSSKKNMIIKNFFSQNVPVKQNEVLTTCRFFCRQAKSFTIKIRKQGTNY